MKQAWSGYGPLVLRLVVGIGFVYHGFPKMFSGAEHAGFVGMLTGMGIPAPGIMAWVVAILEVFGGLALIAGVFTTIVGSLLVVEMLVAIFKAHWAAGFSFVNITGMTDQGPTFGLPGYEVPLLYAAALVALILGGPGAFSVEGMRAPKMAGPPTGSYGVYL